MPPETVPETVIEDKVFDEWCNDGIDMLSKITNQLSIDLQMLDKLLQEPKAKEYLNALTQILNALDDGKSAFIKTPDKSYFRSLLNDFNTNLGNLYIYVAL